MIFAILFYDLKNIKIQLNYSATERILVENDNVPHYKSITIDTKIKINPPVNRKESLRDFIKTLGSLTSISTIAENFESSKSGIIHQLFASFAVFILGAGCGHPIGFSAILLPQLYTENSTLQVDIEMGSWIASVHSAASPVGSLVAGSMMEYWGRKRTLELSVPPMILGWLCLTFASHISIIIIGRLFCGYGVGNMAAASQVYLSEISDPWLRGALIGTPFVSYSIGVLIVYVLGELPWRWVASFSLILPTLAGLLLLVMPESPVWLIKKSKISKGHKALLWLRGNEQLVKKDLHEIVRLKAINRENGMSEKKIIDLIKEPSGYKPLLIINIFNLLQILSGTYLIIFYAVDIIKDATGDGLDSIQAATYTAIARLIFSIIACFLLFYLSRRTLSIISGIGSSTASLILGIYLIIRKEEKTDLDFWITISCLLIYIAFNTIGFFILPSLMAGELLPLKIRGMCGGYIFMIFNLLLFAYTKAYPLIKRLCGTSGLFLIFGISSFLGTLFLFLVLPETHNKSLTQLENYFKNSKFIWIMNK